MSIDITHADRGMIHAVLENLRMEDHWEMMASGVDLNTLPAVIMRHKVFAFCAFDYETGPIAIWGLVNRREGVGAGFAFGTEAWPRAVIPMLRQIRGFVLPFLGENGYHRVEAAAMARRDDVARFMGLIGAEPEGLLRGYGTGGEDFTAYRWLRDEHGSASADHAAQNNSHTAH
jgi:hypothetical protein